MLDTEHTEQLTGPARMRIPCGAPSRLSWADILKVADRIGLGDGMSAFARAEKVYTARLGPGAFIVCPSCNGGAKKTAPGTVPVYGCPTCMGTGYQWAIENGDGAGGWAFVDWSVVIEPLQGPGRE